MLEAQPREGKSGKCWPMPLTPLRVATRTPYRAVAQKRYDFHARFVHSALARVGIAPPSKGGRRSRRNSERIILQTRRWHGGPRPLFRVLSTNVHTSHFQTLTRAYFACVINSAWQSVCASHVVEEKKVGMVLHSFHIFL